MYKIFNEDCLVGMSKIEDKSIDLVFIDPPYGFLKHKIETEIDKVRLFQEYKRVLKDTGRIAYFGKMPFILDWYNEAIKVLPFKQEIIWDKIRGSNPAQNILKCHENVYVHSKSILNEVWVDLEYAMIEQYKDMSGIARATQELKTIFNKPEKLREYADYVEGKNVHTDKMKRIDKSNAVGDYNKTLLSKSRWFGSINMIRKGYKARSVVTFTSNNFSNKYGKYNHPTVKPVSLCEYIINLCSNEGDIVLDSFMGSGTTGIACQNLNRIFVGFEFDKEYYQIAEKRLIENAEKLENSLFSEVV